MDRKDRKFKLVDAILGLPFALLCLLEPTLDRRNQLNSDGFLLCQVTQCQPTGQLKDQPCHAGNPKEIHKEHN